MNEPTGNHASTATLDGPARARAQGHLDVDHIPEIQARYVRGVRGKPGNKADLAAEYGVTERDIAGAAAGKRCTVVEDGEPCRRTGMVIDGMCFRHWQRTRKHGDPLSIGKRGPAPKPGPKPKRDKRIYPCADGCGRKVAAKDARCMDCHRAKRKAEAEAAPRPTCADCCGPVSTPKSERCRACQNARRAAEANRACTFPGCPNTDVQLRNGLCPMHDRRQRAHGDPSIVLRVSEHATVETVLWNRIDDSGGPDACWPYTGKINRFGYGMLHLDGRDGPTIVASRYVWAISNGVVLEDLPESVEVDHMCHNLAYERGECAGGPDCLHRRCCNPRHLRATTHAVNTLAGAGPAAVNDRKTHCVRNHPFEGPGSDVRVYGNGWRACRRCERERRREKRMARMR